MRYASFLLLTGLLLPALVKAQSLNVIAISPTANAVSAERETAVVIDFNQQVDPASFDATSMMVFGRWTGVAAGTLSFEQNNTRVRFVPDRPFSAGEMVTVSLARHLTTPNGTALGKGYAWQFWTRPRRASMDLQETERLNVRLPFEGHIQTYGAYAGDFDDDGYTDFAVPNEKANDVRMFMNDGTGGYDTFTTYPIPRGGVPSTNEGADFNLDGHLDFAVGNSQSDRVSVFMGDGTGHLDSLSNYVVDEGVRGLGVLDLNGDGYPDIATANRDAGTVSVLLNDGDGTFTRTQNFSTGGNGETAGVVADMNEDGILDFVVGTFDSNQMIVLLGDGEGRLDVHLRVAAGGSSWMIAAGDVNGDGHVDIASANSNSNNASVLRGDGKGNLLAPVTYPTGAFALAIDLGDLDGDGDLDLVTSNFSGNNWTLYENLGDGGFGNRRSLPASSAGSCAVFHDRNNDGTLDMTGIDELDDLLFLFTNTPLQTDTETPPASSALALLPNYPNPFTDQTILPFHLDEPAAVRLVIYDLLGRDIRTLLDASRHQGTHALMWDGRDDAGRLVSGGVYFYRLEIGKETTQTRQLLYVR